MCGVCSWDMSFGWWSRGFVVVLVTSFCSFGVCVRSIIKGSSLDVACGGGVRVGGPFSSGAFRQVVSLIRWEVGESGHFGTF